MFFTRIRSAISDHRLYGAVGFGSPSLYAGLVVTAHLLNLDLGWIRYTLSELAFGRDGWLETASVIVLGICVIAIAFEVFRRVAHGRSMKGGVAALGLTGIAFLTLAVFKSSTSEFVTPAIVVHRAAVIAIAVGFPLGCLIMTPSLRTDEQLKAMARFTLIAGIVGIAIDIAGAVLIGGFKLGLAGLWEKAAIANGIVWCQVMGARLLIMAVKRSRARGLERTAYIKMS